MPRALLILSFTLCFSYLSWRGIEVAGRLAVAICVGCLLPFAVLCVVGAFRLDLTRTRTWSDDLGKVRHDAVL